MPNSIKFFNDGKGNVRQVPVEKLDKFKSIYPNAQEATEEQLSQIEEQRATQNEQKGQKGVTLPKIPKQTIQGVGGVGMAKGKSLEDAASIASEHIKSDPSLQFKAKYGAYKEDPQLHRDQWQDSRKSEQTRLSEKYLTGVDKSQRQSETESIQDFLTNTPSGRKFVEYDKSITQGEERFKNNIAEQVDEMLATTKQKMSKSATSTIHQQHAKRQEDRKKPFIQRLVESNQYGSARTPFVADDFINRVGGNPYGVAEHYLEDAQRIINEASKSDGNVKAIARGVRDSVLDVDNWAYGITEADREGRIKDAVDRFERGEELKEGEQEMLDALALNMAVNQYYADGMQRGYGWGETAGVSLPYMVEFILNPISGTGKGIAKGIAKYGLKRFAVKGGARTGIKAASRLAGDLTAGLGMTLTTGAAKTTGDIFNRMMGDATYNVDDDNKISYGGHVGGKGTVRSITEAIAANTIEYQSETMGDSGIGRVLTNNKMMRGLSRSLKSTHIGQFFARMNNSNWKRTFSELEKRAQWNGLFEEWGEEAYGTFMNAIFIGDEKLKDLVDLEQQVDTFMGLSITGGAMSGLRTGSYVADRANTRRKLNRDSKAASKYFDNWEETSKEFQNLSAEDRSIALTAMLQDNSIPKEAKEAFTKYAQTQTYHDSLTGAGEEVQKAREQKRQEGLENAPKEAAELVSQHVNESTGTVVFGKVPGTNTPVQLKGDIAFQEDGKIDPSKSGEIYYTDPVDGKTKVADPHFIDVTENTPADQLTEEITKIKQTQVENEYANDEVRPYEVGEMVRFTPDGATSLFGVVHGINEDGTYSIAVNGMNKPTTIEPRMIIPEDNLRGVENGVMVEYKNDKGEIQVGEVQDTSLRGVGAIVIDGKEIANENIIGLEGATQAQQEAETQAEEEAEQSQEEITVQPELTPEQQEQAQYEAEKQEFMNSLPIIEAGKGKGQIDQKNMTTDQTMKYFEYQYGVEETIKAAEQQVKNKEADLKRAQTALEKDPFNIEKREKLGQIQSELDEYKSYVFNKKKQQTEANKKTLTSSITEAQDTQQQINEEKEQAEAQAQLEKESVEGVPDFSRDKSEWARARGFRVVNGVKYDRAKPLVVRKFKEALRKFTTNKKDQVPVKRTLVEANTLHPSHKGGQPSPMHFISKGQPKNRTDEASQNARDNIATNPNPEEITGGVSAYTNAPIANALGEIIQGNNRTDALQEMYAGHQEAASTYKQFLIDNAEQFGMTAEEVAAMEAPVAIDIVDVDDTEAIRLGQFTASDMESGGVEHIPPKQTAVKMGNRHMERFVETLFNSNNPEASISDLIAQNGADAVKFLLDMGHISPTQYQSAINENGNLTERARQDVRDIAAQVLFEEGADNLPKMFLNLPYKAQASILQTIHRDDKSAPENRIKAEIQDAIEAYNILMQSKNFKEAKTYKDAKIAANTERGAKDFFNSESEYPLEKYSNFVIELAVLFKTDGQKELRQRFNDFYDSVQGVATEMFSQAEQLEMVEAIKKHFNEIDYVPNGQEQRNNVDEHTTKGKQGRQEGTGETTSGERDQTGKQPTDSRTGTDTDNKQRGESRPKTDVKAVRKAVEELSKKLNTPITIYESAEEIPTGKYREKQVKAKGWYLKDKVYLNLYNAESVEDARKTIFHEVVAHKGMRDMLGKEKHAELMNSIFDALPKQIQDALLEKYKSKEIAADEYVAYLAENEKNLTPQEKGTWESIKQAIIDFIENHIGIKLTEQNVDDVIRGLLVESKKRLESKGKPVNLVEVAKESVEKGKVDKAAKEVNTNPTEAQKEAGNYKKGHIKVAGFDITIENPKNTDRKGVDKDGKEWSVKMNNHYGYFKRTKGKDGDHIDVFVGDNLQSEKVFVVDQINEDGAFDEHKVMLGFDSAEQAKEAYLSNYEDGWNGLKDITETTVDDFKKWIDVDTKKSKAFADYKENQTAKATAKKLDFHKWRHDWPKGIVNIVNIRPYRVGAKFSKAEMAKLENWIKSHGFELGRDSKNTVIRVILPTDVNQIEADRYFTDNGIAKLHEQKEQAEKEKKKKEADLKDRATKNRESYNWIIDNFGEDTLNNYNINALADFIEGKKPKFEGMISNKWLEPATKLDVVKGNGVDFQKLKSIYDAKSEPTTVKKEAEAEKYGSQNKIISQDQYNELREKLKNKLNNLNIGFDPEVFSLGAQMAAYHIEAGAVKFKDFAQRMIADVGETVRPYLKSFYEGARLTPGFENLSKQMDAHKDVVNADVENIDKEEVKTKEKQTKQQQKERKKLVETKNKTKFVGNEQQQGNRDKTRLDNTEAVGSSTISGLVGEQQKSSAINRTVEASNNAGSESAVITIEEREELESRGINPDWNRPKFLQNLKEQAKKNGVWLDESFLDNQTLIHDQKTTGTAENDLYLSPDGKTITKVNNLSYVNSGEKAHNLNAFIDRLTTHNELFPDVAYNIIGFAENKHGQPSIVLQQSFIEAERNATAEEINAFLTDKGFEKAGVRTWSNNHEVWSNGTHEIFDARPANVLIDKGGNLRFIDTYPHSVAYMDSEAKSKATQKIEDFGEVIEGAKKHTYERIEAKEGDIKSQPLSKTFPKPDYGKLVQEGVVSKKGAVALKFYYDQIGRKPRNTYKLSRWTKQVQDLLDLYNIIIDDVSNGDAAYNKLTNNTFLGEEFKNFVKLQEAFGFPENDVNMGAYRIISPSTVEVVKGSNKKWLLVKGNYIQAEAASIEGIVEKFNSIVNNNKKKGKDVKLDIYQDTVTKEYFIGRKTGGGVIRLVDGLTRDAAIKMRKEENAKLQELWQASRIKPEERRKANRERTGKDYRDGKNITPEKFEAEFGFRGVQFGNWVNNLERQEALNDAYDAFMDLANVIGVSPRALSLAGELGMAFGARGSGNAMAHYESGKVVINLTKRKGAGSLAHEWWHAMDNYFSRMRGRKGEFITSSPKQRIVGGKDGKAIYESKVRKEMHDAFVGVMDAIKQSELPKRSKELDKTRSAPYWATDVEMSARAFESYIVDKLAETAEQNDYLANFKEAPEFGKDAGLDAKAYPYPMGKENATINEAFNNLFEAMQEKQKGEDVILFREKQAEAIRFRENQDFRDGYGAPAMDYETFNEAVEEAGNVTLSEIITGKQELVPGDFFDTRKATTRSGQQGYRGAILYGFNTKSGIESIEAIKRLQEKTEDGADPSELKAKAYRAIPNTVDANKLIDGDWVSLSKDYVEKHGLARFGKGEYKIIEQDVPVNKLWWDGNDINELGYDTQENIRFRETDQIIEVTPFKYGEGGTKGTFKGKDGTIYKSLQGGFLDWEDGRPVRRYRDLDTQEYIILKMLEDDSRFPQVGDRVETNEGAAFEIEKLERTDNITFEEYVRIEETIQELNSKGIYLNDFISAMRRPGTNEVVINDFSNGVYDPSRIGNSYYNDVLFSRIEEILPGKEKAKLDKYKEDQRLELYRKLFPDRDITREDIRYREGNYPLTYKLDNDNADYYIRHSENIDNDMKRGWSSWNFGQEGFEGTEAELQEALSNITDENPFWISGFDIYPDRIDEFEIKELYPNYWVVVDNVNARGGLSAHILPNNLSNIEDAIKEISSKKWRYDGTGEGDSFDASDARVIYSKDGVHIIEVGENTLEQDDIRYRETDRPQFSDAIETVVERFVDRVTLKENEFQKDAPNLKELVLSNDVKDYGMYDKYEIVPVSNPVVNIHNLNSSIYGLGSELRPLKDLHSKGLLNFKEDTGYFDAKRVKAFAKEFNQAIDPYETALLKTKHFATEAAQREIMDIIKDIDHAKDYYRRLAKDQSILRTEEEPRFRETDTPEFKAWFGDSKVVDEAGKPLVVYHGTFQYEFNHNYAKNLHEAYNKSVVAVNKATGKTMKLATIEEVSKNTGLYSRALDAHQIEKLTGKDFYEIIAPLTNHDITQIRPFTVFDKEKQGISTEARDNKHSFFFTDNKDFATHFSLNYEINPYSGEKRDIPSYIQKVYPVYLKAENLADLTTTKGLKEVKKHIDIPYTNIRSAADSKSVQEFLYSTPEKVELLKKHFDGVVNKVYDNDGRVQKEYQVFEPTQIKSATENIGTFDSSNEDIRYRMIDELVDETGSTMSKELRDEFDKKYQKFSTRLREAWEDQFLPVKDFLDILHKNGLEIAEHNDFYKQATHLPGKNDYQLQHYLETYQKPITKAVNSLLNAGFEYRDIENYLFAKHGVERNEYMRRAAAKRYADAGRQKAEMKALQDRRSAENQLINETITQEEYDNLIEKIETAKEKKFDKLIDAEEKKYQELQKVDYAGLTALMEEVNADGVEQGISLDDLADIHAKEFESRAGKEAINNLWGAIKKATDFTLENHYKTGGLSRDAYTELKNRYKNFVPLRGHDAETAEDKWHYTNGNMGTYYSDPIMRAKGRATRAESPIAYIAQMAHSAILRGNRNTLNQTLLRLAHKDKSGLMNISKTWYVNKGTLEDPIWEMETAPFHDNPDSYIQNQIDFEERMKELEEIGMASQQRKGLDIGGLFIKPKQSEQHEINVDQNGTRYTIYINADPAIARAVNGENSKSIAKGMGFIGNVTRAMAMNFTTRNPLFIARNFSRDYIFANTMLMVKEDATYTARFNENIPLAFAALTRQKKGKLDLNNKTDMYLHEFMMNGGRTGFSHIFELDRVAKRLEKEALKGDSKNALDYGKLALSAIDVVNDVVENATRLSTYMASRQDGRSITQSIHDAKNVTVNFNQKGAGSSIGNNSFERFILSAAGLVRPLYLFTNAAVQALSNVAKATKIHPARMGAAVTSFALMGFMSPIIAGMIGGDDGEEEFMKQTDWDRQNNWIIPTGGGFVKIPLPHEMRVFHRLGDNIYQVATGRKDKLESMLDMVFALSDLLPMNPAGAADASLAELFPDFSKPYGQHLFNTSFMGTRIYNEWANPNAPGYTKVTTNKKGEAYAPAFLIELYKNADHWTGGDGVKKGKISLNPDVTNHYMRGWFGGLWTMTEQIIDIAYKTSEWRKTGEFDLKVRETPISSFYTNKSDLNVSSGSTGNRFYKLSKEVSEIRRQNKGYLKKVNDGEMSIADYAKKVKELDLRRANRINEKIKVVRNMESELKDLKGQEQKELEAKIFKKKKEILEMQ